MSLLIPNEILNLIAFFSCKNRQYECLYVSHSWLTSFKPCLYHKIQIKSRRHFRQLLDSIQQQDNKAGLYVKELLFDFHVGITRDEFMTLFRAMPLLEKVDFNPKLWKYFPYQQTTTAKWKRIKKLPLLTQASITQPIFQHYSSSLKELSMAASCFDDRDIISFFANSACTTQQLRRLQLYCDYQTEFTLNNLITLHSELPLLEELDLLDFTFVATTSDDPEEQLAATNLQQQYKKLNRLYIQGQIKHFYWISIISQFYPNLLDLKVNLTVYDGDYQQQEILKDPIISIARDCQFLENIKLNGIDSSLLLSFYQTLSATRKNKRALKSIDGISTTSNATKSLSTAILNCCDTKRTHTLKLQLWRDLWSFDTIMHSISNQCQQLKSLELNCGKYAFSWNYGLNLNVIFKHCSQLKELTLSMGKMTVNNSSTQHATRLESVTLNQVHFTTRSINYITRCCSNLQQFRILNCIKDRDELQQKISIDLSHQTQLHTLIIQHVYHGPSRFIEKSSIDVALLSVNNTKETRWYHLNNNLAASNGKNTRQLKRLNEEQANQVQTYQMSQKDWDHLEEETSVRGTFREFKYWQSDLPYGHLELVCNSSCKVKNLMFNKVKL